MTIRKVLITTIIICSTLAPCFADKKSDLLNQWNAEKGRERKLEADEVLIKESDSAPLAGLVAAGFRQSDGGYALGRVIWKGQTLTPLRAFGAVLKDKGFATLEDADRRTLFLALLQATYGSLGTKPYTGEPSKRKDRPWPIVGLRSVDNSHRFQVWFCELPLKKEDGEWREVLYTVSSDGSEVRARTLGSYHPAGERLRDFPAISSELFE